MKRWMKLVTEGAVGAKASLRDKHLIFRRGAPAQRVYVLTSGAVEVSQAGDGGQGVIVKILAAPTMFGVIEPLAGERHYLETVRTAGRCVVYGMSREAFTYALSTTEGAATECLRDMAMAFCQAARFESVPLVDKERLLANLFCAYSELFGVETVDGRVLMLRRSQADLAKGVAAGERSVNRILSRWQELNWLVKRSGRHVVLRADCLQAVAGELHGSLIHRFPVDEFPSVAPRVP